MVTRSDRRGIGALSKRTGCNIETIRYYERIGLMPPSIRSEGGHRLYGEAQSRRLGFIRRTRALGFTLDQIRTLLTLVDGGRYTCAQVKRITVHHLDEVRSKLADLRTIERVLGNMAAPCGAGSVPKCPIIDALFGGATSTQTNGAPGGNSSAKERDRSRRRFSGKS